MTPDITKSRAAAEAARLEQKFGHKTGAVGSTSYKLNVVPTGSLALDYALGTGGWPLGYPCEVFGAPDIGKSSVIGLSAIRNAQALGMLCGIIALEPGFDKAWAIKNGVDPEGVIIARPDNGEDAFEILHDWTQGDIVDFMLFDSIGAVVSEIDRKEGAKSRVGGQAKLITDGVKKILTPTWRNNKGLIFLNQQRDDIKAKIPGMVESPGGHALHHSASIRVHLKSKDAPIKTKVDGEDVVVGRTLVAVIKRNKLSEGTGKRAEFDYYSADSDESVVGIDFAKDIVATAIRTSVIAKAGGYYRHETFPGDKHQFQGKDAVYDFLTDPTNSKSVATIRTEVLSKMQTVLEKNQESKSGGD